MPTHLTGKHDDTVFYRSLAVLTPLLFSLALYWPGLWAWFAQDDFAWLSLRLGIYTWADFWRTLFSPQAQGTVRFLSERGFFLLFEYLFGLHSLPFRICVLVTQVAAAVLLGLIARRITGSRIAQFAAPLLWTVNEALSSPMSWTSAYNQILWSFLLLASLLHWIRYTDTGERRFYIWQFITFLLGFGANELNVVYPAIAAAWALTSHRRYWTRTLPMFAVSAAYAVVHRLSSPKPSGVYTMHWDLRLWTTLRTYWKWALGPEWIRLNGSHPALLKAAGTCLSLSVLAFLAWRLCRKDSRPLFLAAWFLLPLLPLLPLREHMTPYYLTAPVMSLAIILSYALVLAWRNRHRLWLGLTVLFLGLYSATNGVSAWRFTEWERARSQEIKTLVGSVLAAQQHHPGKVIVLHNITSPRFWGTFMDNPFRLVGVKEVYLTPGSSQIIEPMAGIGNPVDYEMEKPVLAAALEREMVEVYDASTTPLRNITQRYSAAFLAQPHPGAPASVIIGSPLYTSFLGEGWFPIEGTVRWMGQRSSVRLANPGKPSILTLQGWTAESFLNPDGVSVHLHVDGQDAGSFALRNNESSFVREFPLPASTDRQREMTVTLECSKTFRTSGDHRNLSLLFGRISVH